MGYYTFKEEDAEAFARHINARTRRRSKELQFEICPYCESRTDKWKFAISMQTGQFKCLRATCGAHGNMIRLSQDFDFSLGDDVDEYYGRSRRKYRDLTRYPLPETRDAAVTYMESRGIPADITKQYHITTRKDDQNIIVFPFIDEKGRMQFVKYRNAAYVKGQSKGSKEWCETGCKQILFGMDQCSPDLSKTLVMTEGQIDSLSVAACGIPNAISVPTGMNGFRWTPHCWNFFEQYEVLIVFGDYEHDRITLVEEMKQRFHGSLRHVRPEDYLDCKDANELLTKHGKQAVIDAVTNAVPVADPYIRKLSEIEPRSTADLTGITTGIKALDRLIGKLYFGQLVVITGKRGLGKSTFCSQLIMKAVGQNERCFCYSGELPSWRFQEWIDRQFAGPDHIKTEVSTYGYESHTIKQGYANRIHKYYDEFLYIYDNSTVLKDDDARANDEKLLDTVEKAIKDYECRVILIDNLMIAMDDNLNLDMYRQQGEFVKKLAALVRRYEVLIMLIVHPRKGQGSEQKSLANDDISGSANITNLADVVLSYNPAGDDDPGDRRLAVIKNRLNGKLADGIGLYFHEPSKRISETERFDWTAGWNDGDAEAGGFAETDDAWDNGIPY